MAESPPKMEDAGQRQDEKDEKLYKEIVEVLGKDGPQRVLLAGEAGIGKTRLAKMVGKHATVTGSCFLTIFLHLDRKFDDELSLYENIASQLCLYSDFEETEVDDRDEDEEEEKKPETLLADLKKMITEEIQSKAKEVAEKKAKQVVEKKAKELAEKTKDKTAKNVKKPPADGKEKTPDDEGEKKPTPPPYLLLILDDEGNKTSEDKVMEELKLDLFLRQQKFLKDDKNRLKILITKRKEEEEEEGVKEDTKSEQEDSEHKSDDEIKSQDSEHKSDDEIKSQDSDNASKAEPQDPNNAPVLEPDVKGVPSTGDEFQTTDKSESLLKSINEPNLKDLFASLMKDWKTYENFIDDIVAKSKNSPAAVFVLAKSLKRITPTTTNKEEEKKLKLKIEKKIDEVLSAARPGSCENPLLRLAYELLEIGYPMKEAILDCFWHSLDFFEHCGSVYYRDLITQWILEGYFDPVRSVEKAYQDGHSILMELINRGMLKIQENNVVVPERAMSTLIDPRRRGLIGRSRLRFSRVYCGDKRKGIGKITQIDDMIKTVQAKKGDKVSTVLVSGDRLRRETPVKYFKKLSDLEVLGLFEPTLEPFVTAFANLQGLRVLVVRDCDLLTDIEELKALRELHALEVSGASSLKKISDGFFKALSKLQSLHLSGLQITTSPSSISELTELHCLIIKDCPLLEDLPDIQELVKLEVVDISGAHGLQTCFDNTKGEKKNKSKNKNFYHLTRLQLLDFSGSQIERLPIFQDSAVGDKLHSVKRLLLRDCSKLRRLPSLKPLSGLQILDLSGTTSLVEMLEVCFEDKKELLSLNLSGTNLSELAATIEELTNLNKLLMKDCKNIEVIPNIQKLTNLEVIDVSGCEKLHTIEGSFEDMSYLCEVNLSGTKVETPELPKKTEIHCLKRITLADGSRFEGEEWSKIKEEIESKRSDEAISSEAVVEPKEISEEIGEETQPKEAPASDSVEKEDVTKERLCHVPIEKDIYKTILSGFDSASKQEVMKIHESKGEASANTDFVSLVDIDSTRLKSFFSENKSVKDCSLRMCRDIDNLFYEVDGESLGSVETLSISNFPLLETICWGENFKNLKKLSIDCCPKIKTLFPEASQMPNSLKELNIKYCENMETVVEGVELSSLTNLRSQVKKCPKLEETPEDSVEGH
ncbi:probable disease resistance protein At5g45510 isoform X2 [Raphanus sativus]|uniref:Probable disease resistance protein At5g45510 isoform X2 n=1 Tax=Raphanus sativus TaxID=3726 RepID=A0A6J0JV54_RAPSA|nr:probable disease resistance protein At5g45510 isoform X2 [Raphanus sativus]